MVQLSLGVLVVFALVGLFLWQSLTFGAKYIPMAWETRLVSPFIDASEATDPRQQALQERLDRILTAVEYQGEVPIQVTLIEQDIVNAFATLGGRVFVFEGLLDALETDIGLDMVLAHEVAHVLNRDPIQAAAGTLGLQLFFAFVTGNSELGQISGLADAGGQMLFLSYSREQEREADELALYALERLYADLTGADELFLYIERNETQMEFPEFLSSHPDTESRIQTIRSRINE
jgi:Zn-dependent protease with chaperone function